MNELLELRVKYRPKGFTLLEFLISFALVSILLMGAAQLTLHSLITKKTSDCSVESAELASSKLEQLRSLLHENIEPGEIDTSEMIKSLRRNEMFYRGWRIEDVSDSIKKIEMECYAESRPHKSVHLVLFCLRELGF